MAMLLSVQTPQEHCPIFVTGLSHPSCRQIIHLQYYLSGFIQPHHMRLQEYAALLRVQALEQRLAIIKAELKEGTAATEGDAGSPEPMQEA